MKWSLLLSVLFSLTAFAVTPEQVYRRDSKLPKELQARVLERALTCGDYVNHWSLEEKVTTVRAERIDQGITDYYYMTEFRLQYYFDGAHPMSYSIYVESAQYEINNPVEARWSVGHVDCPSI